jgi:hypothetical protein
MDNFLKMKFDNVKDLLQNVNDTGNILKKKIQDSNNPKTKRLTEYSEKQSELILEMKNYFLLHYLLKRFRW